MPFSLFTCLINYTGLYQQAIMVWHQYTVNHESLTGSPAGPGAPLSPCGNKANIYLTFGPVWEKAREFMFFQLE